MFELCAFEEGQTFVSLRVTVTLPFLLLRLALGRVDIKGSVIVIARETDTERLLGSSLIFRFFLMSKVVQV